MLAALIQDSYRLPQHEGGCMSSSDCQFFLSTVAARHTVAVVSGRQPAAQPPHPHSKSGKPFCPT